MKHAYMTRPEAADFLRVSVHTLADWASQKKGPRLYKIGRRVLYRRKDLKRYLEASAIDFCKK